MTEFEKALSLINKKSEDLDKSLTKIQRFYDAGDFLKTNSELFHLVKISENLTERIRVLPIYTGSITAKEEVESIIIDELKIKINYNEDVVHLRLNALLPKKEKERAGYIRTAVISACRDYYNRNSFDIIKEPVVIVFKHNYQDEQRMWRDHDNIEVNVVIDALALYFLEDDTSKSCDHFYFSSLEDSDSTDVFIVKKSKFKEWLLNNYK